MIKRKQEGILLLNCARDIERLIKLFNCSFINQLKGTRKVNAFFINKEINLYLLIVNSIISAIYIEKTESEQVVG